MYGCNLTCYLQRLKMSLQTGGVHVREHSLLCWMSETRRLARKRHQPLPHPALRRIPMVAVMPGHVDGEAGYGQRRRQHAQAVWAPFHQAGRHEGDEVG